MPEHAHFDIKEMAKWLEMRKNNHHPTVLVLGAHTGALFRSNYFYDCMRQFSQRDLSSLPRTEQFSEYYTILTDGRFSEMDIHTIFRTSLQGSSVTKADLCLAELIKHEHFAEIISTNIDDLLELSFQQLEMKEQRDFEVAYYCHDFALEKSCSCRITKIFGDFHSRDYNLKRYLKRSDKEQANMSSLRRLLARDILLVGIDPRWDKNILDAIPSDSGMVWFVSEEDLSKQEVISGLLRQRSSQTIVGREGGFDYFIRVLHSYLYGGMPLNYQVVHTIANLLIDIANQMVDISNQVKALQVGQSTILSEIKALQNKIDKFSQGS